MTTATQYRQQRLEDFNRFRAQARFWRAAVLGIIVGLWLVSAMLAYFIPEWWSYAIPVVLTLIGWLFLEYGYIRFRCPVCEQEAGDNRAISTVATQCPTCRTTLE